MSIAFHISEENELKLSKHLDALIQLSRALPPSKRKLICDTVIAIADLSYCKPDYWTLKQLFSLIIDANTWLFESADATPRDSVDQPE